MYSRAADEVSLWITVSLSASVVLALILARHFSLIIGKVEFAVRCGLILGSAVYELKGYGMTWCFVVCASGTEFVLRVFCQSIANAWVYIEISLIFKLVETATATECMCWFDLHVFIFLATPCFHVCFCPPCLFENVVLIFSVWSVRYVSCVCAFRTSSFFIRRVGSLRSYFDCRLICGELGSQSTSIIFII